MEHTKEEKLKEFGRLLDIMDRLRAECPWNGAQTIDTLRPLTLGPPAGAPAAVDRLHHAVADQLQVAALVGEAVQNLDGVAPDVLGVHEEETVKTGHGCTPNRT